MSHHGFLTVVFLFIIFGGGYPLLPKNGTCWALPLFCPLEM